ncbi:unnamed protein product [Rhizoctonia solani]|uniref:CSC1/OSCA1-like 7TM region domain-containing protein n=1 Tax=Rhizoctonia solani TaxID=456999 RepID=A0A8H2X0G7_9AGAM|nr:unnamed protein product [Rhizoctonia solani]
MTTGLTNKGHDQHLKSRAYVGRTPWKNCKKMLKDLDKLRHGPDWDMYTIVIQEKNGVTRPEYLFGRNIIDVIRSLLANPAFKNLLRFAPERHWTCKQSYRMAKQHTEVAPADVIWGNLGINPYEERIRKAICYAATAGLMIFWAIPVSFGVIVSNVSQHCRLPDVVVGIISGILPPVALAILMMLLPIVLRLLARFEGIPRFTGLELSLMTRYFIFQVIHSFLIATISSGLIAALPQLASNPTRLAGSAGGLLQIVPLVLYYVKLYILGSNPCLIYTIRYSLRNVAWGTLFPAMTLITGIGLAYSNISPIINGLVCVAFFLFYQVWKYLFLWQLGQPEAGNTGGLSFPKAV